MQAANHLCGAAAHHLDRPGAISCVGECLHIFARGRSDVLPRDVGDEPRLAEDARVDNDDVGARLCYAVAKVRVLVAFRIERTEQDDRGAALNVKLLVRQTTLYERATIFG